MLNNRKVLLINRPFQLSMLTWFFILAFALIAVFAVANWFFFENLVELGKFAQIPTGHVFYKFIDHQRTILLRIYLIASVISFLLIIIGGLILSHRIAGPLHRLRKHLDKSSKGDVATVSFRKGDYFHELEQSFNDFTKR